MSEKKVTMKDAEVLAFLAETPLASLINNLLTGELQIPPTGPIVSNETVIGELSSTEKAFWSAYYQLGKKAEEIANKNNAMVHQAEIDGTEVDESQVYMNQAEFRAMLNLSKGLSNCLWFLIRKRIGAPAMEGDVIGIRDEFQLVTYPPLLDGHEMLFELPGGAFS